MYECRDKLEEWRMRGKKNCRTEKSNDSRLIVMHIRLRVLDLEISSPTYVGLEKHR